MNIFVPIVGFAMAFGRAMLPSPAIKTPPYELDNEVLFFPKIAPPPPVDPPTTKVFLKPLVNPP